MTLGEFYAANLGKFVEFDGKFPNQCVDLTKKYNRDVVGAPVLMGNAADYIKNPLPEFYDFIKNTLMYIPPLGAIAVWNNNVGGGFGHVAIVLKANILTFTSLDQNWPTGSPVHEVIHNYINVVGFLVVKARGPVTVEPTPNKDLDEYKAKTQVIKDSIINLAKTLT